MNHLVSENDLFVILGSDGLFDFFKNDDVVEIVHQYIKANPFGDPAKYLIEQLICKAAENAGMHLWRLLSYLNVHLNFMICFLSFFFFLFFWVKGVTKLLIYYTRNQ